MHTLDTSPFVVHVAYEAFSLPIKEAGDIQRQGISDRGLYAYLISGADGVGKQERLITIRTKPALRAKTDSVTDYMYPTRYSVSASSPDSKANDQAGAAELAKRGVPRLDSFETKKIGDTLEVEPIVGEDRQTVDLTIAVSHVAYAGENDWPAVTADGAAKTPKFDTRTLSTSIVTPVNSPRLIGTLSPVFGNGLPRHAGQDKQEIWFCFVTASLVKVDPPATTTPAAKPVLLVPAETLPAAKPVADDKH